SSTRHPPPRRVRAPVPGWTRAGPGRGEAEPGIVTAALFRRNAMYRAAILGCGPRAVGHAEAYAHVTRGRLVAACDRDRGRLAPFCDRFQVEGRSTDLGRVLDRVWAGRLRGVSATGRAENTMIAAM